MHTYKNEVVETTLDRKLKMEFLESKLQSMMGNKLVREETWQQTLKTVVATPESRGKIYHCQKSSGRETSLWLWVRALKSARYR